MKKTMKNRLAVAGLCFTLTAGMLTGCSGNSGKAIITLDGQKTEYAVANIVIARHRCRHFTELILEIICGHSTAIPQRAR